MTPFRIRPAIGGLLLGAAMVAIASPASAQDYRDDPPPPPEYSTAPQYPADAEYPAYREPAYRDDRRNEQDIVVYGYDRGGRLPDDVSSVSQPVSYADLDLRYAEDRAELRHRVSETARDLCERLDQTDNSGLSLAPSCREAATRDAMRRVGTVEAHYVPRDSVLIPPRRRVEPYPASWDQ